jgi:hypothetical protein
VEKTGGWLTGQRRFAETSILDQQPNTAAPAMSFIFFLFD